MADSQLTADSAARLDPATQLIAKPACPQGHGAVAQGDLEAKHQKLAMDPGCTP